MVAAKEYQMSQQFTAQNSSYLDNMAFIQREQNYSLPSLPPAMLASYDAFPGLYTSDFCGLNTGQQDTVGGVPKPDVPYCNISHPTGSIYLNNAQGALLHELDAADKAIDDSTQKRFLIFDRSGSHTRLFFSPSFSPRNQMLASKIQANANCLREEMATQIDQQFLMKPDLEENCDENDFIEGEGEMREDTEEINALLYSDSDDDDDDEVTSTGHSPFITEEGYDKDNKLNEDFTEVANSDESPKRQRLLDGKYKKSSLENAKSLTSHPVSQCYEENVESSCASDTNHRDDKRERKMKIRQALMTLASIIPGLNIRDSLSIIDKAIVHLKSMKTEAEAEALERSYCGCNSTTSPPNNMSNPVE